MQKPKTLSLLAIATCLLLQDLCAKDLGVFGTLFPIEENNLLDVIQTRLAKLQQVRGQVCESDFRYLLELYFSDHHWGYACLR